MSKKLTLLAAVVGVLAITALNIYLVESEPPLSPEIEALTKKSKGQITDRISESETTVTIHYGWGGWVNAYYNAGIYVVRSNKKLRILADCHSACTYMADIVKSLGGDVCVGSRAVFGYHNMRAGEKWMPMRHMYSKPIGDWVENNGGWKDGPFTFQKGEDLTAFYPLCDDT